MGLLLHRYLLYRPLHPSDSVTSLPHAHVSGHRPFSYGSAYEPSASAMSPPYCPDPDPLGWQYPFTQWLCNISLSCASLCSTDHFPLSMYIGWNCLYTWYLTKVPSLLAGTGCLSCPHRTSFAAAWITCWLIYLSTCFSLQSHSLLPICYNNYK